MYLLLEHYHFVALKKFQADATRNSVFGPGLPLWCQITIQRLILGGGLAYSMKSHRMQSTN